MNEFQPRAAAADDAEGERRMPLIRRTLAAACTAAILGAPAAWAGGAGDGQVPSHEVTIESVEAADVEQLLADIPSPGDLPDLPDLSGVLTVDAALRIALEQNPTLEVVRTRIEQAKQRVIQARSAYFPTVNARYGVTKTWLPDNQLDAQRSAIWRQQRGALSQQFRGIGGAGGVGGGLDVPTLASNLVIWGATTRNALDIDTTREQYTGSLQANWIVFDGFERKFNYASARLAREEFETLYDEFSRQLLAAVADTYYRAQLARQFITIAEADQEFQERQLRDAEARRRVGTGSLSDMLNFEVGKNRAMANLLDATRAYDIALIGLATLLGFPESQFPEGVSLLEIEAERPAEMAQPEEDDLVFLAFEQRPDVLQQRLAIDRSEAGVGAARAPFYPRVVASASVDALREDTAWPDANDYSRTLGLSVTYELFAGGRNRAALVEARERAKEAQWELTALELEAAQEVRTAAESVRIAQQLLMLERRNAELVERTRDLVEREYRAGQASLVRLNEAQRDYIQAEANLVSALVGLRRAWYELRSATGETLL